MTITIPPTSEVGAKGKVAWCQLPFRSLKVVRAHSCFDGGSCDSHWHVCAAVLPSHEERSGLVGRSAYRYCRGNGRRIHAIVVDCTVRP